MLLHVLRMCRKLRACLLILILLGLLQYSIVISGIRLCRLDLKQVSACLPLDFFGDSSGIASSGKIGYQGIFITAYPSIFTRL